MNSTDLPKLVSAAELAELLSADAPVVVDLSRAENRARTSIPGAIGVEYSDLVASRPPVGGLMPEAGVVGAVLGAAGLTRDSAVVACDDEGGGRSGRLLFTLDALGHEGPRAMLDGGTPAWLAESLPCAPARTAPLRAAQYAGRYTGDAVADSHYILGRLGDPDLCLLDTRSPGEFDGSTVRAARGGHIPGAVSFDWVRAMDPARARQLRPAAALRTELESLGVTPDREIVAYCQTHHRSSHTYWMLRWLGFERVRGYPGAWSEWGNDPDLPVER